jgi:hypothetical protein
MADGGAKPTSANDPGIVHVGLITCLGYAPDPLGSEDTLPSAA